MLFIRGVLQVTAADILSHGMDAAISGIAGIGHLVLGVSISNSEECAVLIGRW